MFHRHLELSLIFLLLAAVVLLVWACAPRKAARPSVAVSIGPQQWLLRQIAGDRVDVQVMVPPGASPESYDPTPRDMMRLSASAAYFMIGGLGFERAWAPRLRDQNPSLRLVDTSVGVERLAESDGNAGDPHVWTTPRNMAVMARNVCSGLCRAFPADSTLFEANLSALEERLEAMHERIRQQLVIARTRTFVIYHPALSYLARDYGMVQLAVEHDHKEPSAAQLRALVDSVRSTGARVLLMQQEYDARLVETLAAETGLRVVRINLLTDDWETELMRIVLEVTR